MKSTREFTPFLNFQAQKVGMKNKSPKASVIRSPYTDLRLEELQASIPHRAGLSPQSKLLCVFSNSCLTAAPPSTTLVPLSLSALCCVFSLLMTLWLSFPSSACLLTLFLLPYSSSSSQGLPGDSKHAVTILPLALHIRALLLWGYETFTIQDCQFDHT